MPYQHDKVKGLRHHVGHSPVTFVTARVRYLGDETETFSRVFFSQELY